MRNISRLAIISILLAINSKYLQAELSDSSFSLERVFKAEDSFFRQARQAGLTALAAAAEPQLDLKHTIIELRLPMADSTVEGRAGLCLEYLTTGPLSLELHLLGRGMQVSSVKNARGDSLGRQYSNDTGVLTVQLDGSSARQDTLWISYAGELYATMEPDSVAEELPDYLRDLSQIATRDYAYGLSWYWYPSLLRYDDPSRKRSFDIALTVPPGFDAAASGDSVGVTVNADSSRTFRYSTSPYGRSAQSVSFAVGRTGRYSLQSDGPLVTVHTTSKSSHRIEAILKAAEDILRFHTRLYGGTPYPWKNLYILECGREYFGFGVADHSLIFLPREFFAGSSGELSLSELSFLAHEIAHQWWGMQVSHDWSQSAWLAEGMAQFSGYCYVESLIEQSDGELASPWDGYHVAYNIKYGPDSYRLPFSSPEAPYYVVYEKGAFTARTLRYLTGDAAFSRGAHEFLTGFSGRFVSLREFADFWISRNPEAKLDVFFNQWLFSGGCPEYSLRSQTQVAGNNHKLYVRIGQETPLFDLPLELSVHKSDGSSESHRLLINQPASAFEFNLDSPPLSLSLDPGDYIADLHAETADIYLSQAENTMACDRPSQVTARVDSLVRVREAALFWRAGGGPYQSISCSLAAGAVDTLEIPAQDRTAVVEYYLRLLDQDGDTLYAPEGAPDSVLSFLVTAPADRPAEVCWISFQKVEPVAGDFVITESLSLCDLERGTVLHSFAGLGGKLGLSANNRYLVSGSIQRHEVVVFDAEKYEVVHRLPIPEELSPEILQVANDGKTAWFAAAFASDSTAHGTDDLYRVDLTSGEVRRILDLDYMNQRTLQLWLNPRNGLLYVQIYDFRANSASFLSCDSHSGAVIDTVLTGRYTIGGFSRNYEKMLAMKPDQLKCEYNLKEISLLDGGTTEKARVRDSDLMNRQNSRYDGILCQAREAGAYINSGIYPHDIYVIDFSKGVVNRTTVATDPSRQTGLPEIIDLYFSASGKYLAAPYMYPFSRDGRTLLAALVDNDAQGTVHYLTTKDEGLLFRGLAVESPPFDLASLVPGDMDGSGKTDVFDLLDLLKSLGNAPGQVAGLSSDVDGNGKLDVFDLLGLLRLLK